MCLRLLTTLISGLLSAPSVLGEVLSSEFSSDPVSEGWTLSGHWGDPTTWVENGVYYQEFDNDCPSGELCGSEAFTRSIQSFNGRLSWFYEYRLSATGDHTEIPGGAPTVLAAFNGFGNIYRASLASDRVKLQGDADLPILFYDVEPGIPHTIRLELYNDPPPTFRWYVDSVLVLEGLADSPFPDFDSRITWQGRTWMQPTLNAWYYIRAGDPAIEASGDFDSDGDIDGRDFFYFAECVAERGNGPDIPADPGCPWADMDADGDVDFHDFAPFQRAFTGPK